VNLASRLEGLGKVYGVDLVIGEETAARLDDPALAARVAGCRTIARWRWSQSSLPPWRSPWFSASSPCVGRRAPHPARSARLSPEVVKRS
jgi:hypothetical protein